ncbi:flagellar biosynthesis/type III secretory pathway chaperone [Bacillus fengqiuensis]|nr:flagellar biosynthesis/type III secretory pathway chaperone [Bacillus fengqiuensis]
MQTQKMLDLLTKQLKLNKSLLKMARQKTDILKEGDIGALNSMMKDEQAHIAAMNQLEEARKKEAAILLSGHPIHQNEPSLSALLDMIRGEEQEQLRSLQTELFNVIGELQERNSLNQELIMQSLQFVNLNLDMLSPSTGMDAYNYQKEETAPAYTRSLFNSKA